MAKHGPIVRHVAANIRRLRLRAGLTQEEFAEAAEIDARYLQRIEAAEVNIGITLLERLANTLEVSPARLVRPARFEAPSRGRPPRGG